MEPRTLGRTGVKVAPIALGTANFGDPTPEPEAKAMIARALDAGVNLLDTGNIYAWGEGERIIGRALKECGRRHETLISTKIFPGPVDPKSGLPVTRHRHEAGQDPNAQGLSRSAIIKACEASLRRLQTDFIDLYQAHRPDPAIPIDETLAAFDDLVRAGKVRYVGSSTFPSWVVMESLMVSETRGLVRFVSEQPPYNLLDRRIENELIPLCQRHGLGIISWAPMAIGVLAGRYADAASYPADSRAELRGGYSAARVTARGVEVGVEFSRIAADAGITAAQLAVLWCKEQPGITAPLVGPRTLGHLESLLPVMEMRLDDEVRAACDELVPPGSAVADFHNTAGWMRARVAE